MQVDFGDGVVFSGFDDREVGVGLGHVFLPLLGEFCRCI